MLLYMICQWTIISLTNALSFPYAYENYRQLCLPVDPICRNHIYGNSTGHLSSNNTCCGFCDCDTDCAKRGSCCPAIYRTYEDAKKSAESSRFSCVLPQLITTQEKTQYIKAPDVEQVWMVTKCDANFTAYKSERVAKLCEDPDFENSLETVVPVAGKGFHYRNRYCAYCNGDSYLALKNWKLNVFCSEQVSVTDKSLLTTIRKKKCNIFYKAPTYYRAQKCTVPTALMSVLISQCNETGLWPTFDSITDLACTSFTDPFNLTYKNYFCYVCNTEVPVQLDSMQCNDRIGELPLVNPLYKFTYELEIINKNWKASNFLGCDAKTQFSDLKLKKCRNIFCHQDRWYDSGRKTCFPTIHFGEDCCFSIFTKLTVKEHLLKKARLKQSHYLTYITRYVTYFLEKDIAVIKEIRIYPKFEKWAGQSYVDYLVVRLVVDVNETYEFDVLRLFVKHLNKKESDTDTENNNDFVFYSEFSVYNTSSDINGKSKIYVPRYPGPDIDVLEELDLSGSDVLTEFIGIVEDHSCLTKEIRPFKKIDILPSIQVGFNELSLHINSGYLILQENYLEKTFTSWEYELHGDKVQMPLDEYGFIYDVMPKNRLYDEVSAAAIHINLSFTTIASAYLTFVHDLVNILM